MAHFGTIRPPREIIFGPGQRQVLGQVAAGLGQRALVVTDARLADESQFQAMLADLRDHGLAVQVESGTLPDVPVDSALAASQAAATRIRLAKTRDIVAIAKLADGNFAQAKSNVKVTIGGCGG